MQLMTSLAGILKACGQFDIDLIAKGEVPKV